MRTAIAILIAAALLASAAPDAVAQAKKGAECLNPLVCGPQKVPQRKKPAKEQFKQQFMRSAS